jgi:hypothetical protein
VCGTETRSVPDQPHYPQGYLPTGAVLATLQGHTRPTARRSVVGGDPDLCPAGSWQS